MLAAMQRTLGLFTSHCCKNTCLQSFYLNLIRALVRIKPFFCQVFVLRKQKTKSELKPKEKVGGISPIPFAALTHGDLIATLH